MMMILLKDESYDEFVMNKNVGGKFQIKGFFFFFFLLRKLPWDNAI